MNGWNGGGGGGHGLGEGRGKLEWDGLEERAESGGDCRGQGLKHIVDEVTKGAGASGGSVPGFGALRGGMTTCKLHPSHFAGAVTRKVRQSLAAKAHPGHPPGAGLLHRHFDVVKEGEGGEEAVLRRVRSGNEEEWGEAAGAGGNDPGND
ncbi:uncharacterized protein LOC126419707 [Schistocerca serialis cubense]|uniref:uncharacterized protein LOC126419707 n=1 Tax=Schistocerca serialis cubense TaxID=2023355 RepID=UPI00214F07B9|nr:uncharacterized protein LOC126419707 [Schistocerca serialis cubense]